MELIRTLLLRLEALEIWPGQIMLIDGSTEGVGIPGRDVNQINYHLGLLQQKGMFNSPGKNGMDNRLRFAGLTWEGHDLLDSIKNDEVWRLTKDTADGIGSWTVEIIKELAKGFIKKQIEERTGLKI
ncbi:DUF2513 domain-containing protein [Bradyrhizobium sp. Ash2021]|uniref:DUF2513 domain-containing protein n=1 Tax=Bradyrhizobium sp. Ash2021 TaxID=2954771 RepID=UPI002815CD61|nr:DUF2513 domain-containing protein [Bradyrhizobium sp. Ash2021]WMT71136.1 DUF2513 domain-containing protein [Bradyrhizobium sp. Ash2021]